MSVRDDLALARRHPAATGVTLLLALVFGATVGGSPDGGWSTAAALVVVALCAGWVVVVANRPDLFAARASDRVGEPTTGLRRHLDSWTERPGLQGRLTLPAERAQHDRERTYVEAVARNGCDLPHHHGLRTGPRVVDLRADRASRDRRAHFTSAAIQCPTPEGMTEDGYFVTGHVDHPTGARVWRCQRMSFDSVCWWCTGPFARVVEWWHRRRPHPVEVS